MSGDALVLGIDVGTESARAVLFDLTGHARGESSAPYHTQYPRPGWAEQDPAEVWRALVHAVYALLSAVPGAHIVGCSVVSTAVTVVLVAASGDPLGPAILWMDTRASEEAAEITATQHRALWYTGGMVSPEWMLPKALWLKRHDPIRYEQARYLVELHDWLMYRLTGEWALSLSTVSGEWCYVREQGGWPDDLLDTVGLADLPSKWPARVLSPGAVIGYVSRGAAAVTGLRPGLPIVQGLMDSYAAALASNVFAPRRLSLSLGSSSSYLALTPSPRFDPRLCGPVPDAFGEGTWTVHGGQTSAAATLRWFRDQLAPGSSFVILDDEASGVPPGSEGVGALDTLQGCRTPFRDPTSRGVFWGVNVGHRRGHLYRALLEAVAYGGRQVMETIQQAGVTIDEIVACGGGSRSPLWMHIHADVLQVPITVLDEVHAAALGAAMCAAVGTRHYSTLQTAASAMTRAGVTYRPDSERAAVYQRGFEDYRATYVAHRDLQRRRVLAP